MASLWPDLLAQIPDILSSQDPVTGRFGTEPFVVNDQNVVWPLAVAWATPPSADRPNPYFHDQDVLAAIVAGGDALIDVADAQGRFEFRKKDNSTWGWIHMPWTYSRWIRAWALIREAMPSGRRDAWDAALTLACDQIMATALTEPIRNIPAHHAMGLFRASQVLGRTDWAEAAVGYLHRVADEQDPAGFWTEHHGPVVSYNFVYVDALGCYHAMSGDDRVLPALQRASAFHAHLTYPDGTAVETIDERNIYRGEPAAVSVGFLADPVGRGYLEWLVGLRHAAGERLPADTAASLVAYGAGGPQESPAVEPGRDQRFALGGGEALVERTAPWFVALSAYHGPQGPNRWIQDRQAHVSVFHDRVGLVVSGSNTRLQPRWSTFTVGDVALLAHRAGDEDPDFASVPGLDHLPSHAQLAADGLGVDLQYGAAVRCAVRVTLPDRGSDGPAEVRHLLLTESDRPVAAHAGLVAHLGETWQAGGHGGVIDEQPLRLTGAECGGWFAHHGWRVDLPDDALVEWPVHGHDPYTKDGSASLDQARIVVTLPLGTTPGSTGITVRPIAD